MTWGSVCDHEQPLIFACFARIRSLLAIDVHHVYDHVGIHLRPPLGFQQSVRNHPIVEGDLFLLPRSYSRVAVRRSNGVAVHLRAVRSESGGCGQEGRDGGIAGG
jgi:hypothetical protein